MTGKYRHQPTNSVFAQLESDWANGWQLRADALQLRSRLDYLGTYLEGDAGALAQSLASSPTSSGRPATPCRCAAPGCLRAAATSWPWG